jgi:hypothetical protein
MPALFFSMYNLGPDGNATTNSPPAGVKGGFLMFFDKLALVLVIIGALNWGGIGLFKFDTVAFFCGGQTALLARIIYTLVCLAGLWCITLLFRDGESGHTSN